MLWRYTWLFGIAVVIASFVVSLNHVTMYWKKKEIDGCSVSALLSTEIAKPRCMLYASSQLNTFVAEAKRTADAGYGYTRKVVKEDTSYTVLPGLRFIRGPAREATRGPEVGSKMDVQSGVKSMVDSSAGSNVGSNVEISKEANKEANMESNVKPIVKTIVKPIVESIEEPVTSAKPQSSLPATRRQPLRSTRSRRASRRESKRSDRYVKPPPSVKRPNVTMHEKYGTEAFRKEANRHILDMQSRGVCSSENCRAFVGSQRVDFDNSTDCTSRQSFPS